MKGKPVEKLCQLMAIRMALWDPTDTKMVELAKQEIDSLIREELDRSQ